MRNRYQVWRDRRRGDYVAVKLDSIGRVIGVAGRAAIIPSAFDLPHLTYRAPEEPMRISDPRWRVVRLGYQ